MSRLVLALLVVFTLAIPLPIAAQARSDAAGSLRVAPSYLYPDPTVTPELDYNLLFRWFVGRPGVGRDGVHCAHRPIVNARIGRR